MEATTATTMFNRLASDDMFAAGCILAELFLCKPLFDKDTLSLYFKKRKLPTTVYDLPNFIQSFIGKTIDICIFLKKFVF